MIVDDNQSLTYSLKVGLETIDNNYEIIVANSGKQCLEQLEKGIIPDLILLDIMMPQLNGWDVAAQIRKNPKWSSIPFVFLTAKTDSFSKTFGGIVSDDYITKPIDMKTLKQRIDSILDS